MIKEEQKLQNKIEKYLKELAKNNQPVFFEKRQAGGFNYKIGIPDLYIVINGYHIEFEIKKSKGGKLSVSQLKWMERFNSNYKIDNYVIYDFETAKLIIDTYLSYSQVINDLQNKIKGVIQCLKN